MKKWIFFLFLLIILGFGSVEITAAAKGQHITVSDDCFAGFERHFEDIFSKEDAFLFLAYMTTCDIAVHHWFWVEINIAGKGNLLIHSRSEALRIAKKLVSKREIDWLETYRHEGVFPPKDEIKKKIALLRKRLYDYFESVKEKEDHTHSSFGHSFYR